MRVIVRGYDAKGYSLDLVVFDEIQTRMTTTGINETIHGIEIDPKQFPECVKFVLVVQRDR